MKDIWFQIVREIPYATVAICVGIAMLTGRITFDQFIAGVSVLGLARSTQYAVAQRGDMNAERKEKS